LRTLSAPGEPSDEELLHDTFEVPPISATPAMGARSYFIREGNTRRYAALTLGCAIAVVGSLLALSSFYPRLSGADRYYATAPGQQLQYALTDGSQVTLGGDTALRIRFSAKERNIVLERGEALFTVQHDARRPFIVQAATGRITALGTEFVVRRYSRYLNRVEVLVTEGSVEVAPNREDPARTAAPVKMAAWTPVRLAVGEEMAYDGKGGATSARPAEVPVSGALSRAFFYKGQPLAEVIEDIQRYTVRRIEIDPQTAALKYSGYVFPTKLDQWMQGLTEIFPDLVIDTDTDAIRIHSRTTTPPFSTAATH
jgi:transmembrane sensor